MHTGIICTLGPASEKKKVLLKMMRAGMDVARLNFSHSDPATHSKRIRLIRKLNKDHYRKTVILGDLEGYRIRVGKLNKSRPIEAKKGRLLWLTQQDTSGEGNLVPFDYAQPLDTIKDGQHIFIDDGNISLVVTGRAGPKLKTRVEAAGLIREHKGINLPDTVLKFKGLTDKDKKNLDFCAQNKIDYIAQSFVRDKEDIRLIRDYLAPYGYKYKLIAKIESRQGINNIDEIIDACDGIMIARGDMGVSIPVYEVPMVQKQIIRKCKRASKFVITATHMLESMGQSRIPERSEVSDVANAILDGSDYLMLSAETAVGAYPVECVEMMRQIIRFTRKTNLKEKITFPL